jgi:ribonuclease G
VVHEEHRHPAWAEFRKHLPPDRPRTTVSGLSKLAPVELTRKRLRERLAYMLCEPCPTCEGRGLARRPRAVCDDILREARQFVP